MIVLRNVFEFIMIYRFPKCKIHGTKGYHNCCQVMIVLRNVFEFIMIYHFQVLNRTTGLAEICDTQSAMNLLGNESEVSSHQFMYLHAWAAVGYQNSILRSSHDIDNTMDFNQESLDEDSTNDGPATNSSEEDFSDAGSSDDSGTGDSNVEETSIGDDSIDDETSTDSKIGNSSEDSSNEKTVADDDSENGDSPMDRGAEVADCESEPENYEFESEFTEVKNRSGKKYTMYVDHEGQVHAISQHEIYRHRVANWDMEYKDPGCTDKNIAPKYKSTKAWKEQAAIEQQCGLKECSLLQVCMHTTLKRIPPKGIKDDNTRAFRLNKRCPIHKSHYLHLNSKEKIPILAGVSRPCPPQGEKPKDGRQRQRWLTRANRFARYVGALLFPWDRDGDCGVHDWQQLQRKVIEMKHSHNGADNKAKKFYCDTFHLQYLNNVASNMRTTEIIKTANQAWGSEFAQRFSKESVKRFSEQSQKHAAVATTNEQLHELISRATAEKAIAATSTDASKATAFIEQMNTEMDSLYEEVDNTTDTTDCSTNARKEIANWDNISATYDKKWVDDRRTQLNKTEQTLEPIMDHAVGIARTLNPDALVSLLQIRDKLNVNEDWTRVFDHVKETWLCGRQLLLFVHGGPGTGKTTLAEAIMEMATVFNFGHRFSATSGVAGLLNNGTTIHHLLGQQGELTSAQPNVNKIRLRNGNARVIIVDEVRVCRAVEG